MSAQRKVFFLLFIMVFLCVLCGESPFLDKSSLPFSKVLIFFPPRSFWRWRQKILWGVPLILPNTSLRVTLSMYIFSSCFSLRFFTVLSSKMLLNRTPVAEESRRDIWASAGYRLIGVVVLG